MKFDFGHATESRLIRESGGIEATAGALSGGIPSDLRGPLMAVSDETMSIPSYLTLPRSATWRLIRKPASSKSSGMFRSTIAAGAVNPLLIHGRSHGGVAQRIGQTL